MNNKSNSAEQIAADSKSAEETYRISSGIKLTIVLLPFVLMLISAALLALRSTRSAAVWMFQENHPVELMTALLLFAGCAVSMMQSVKAHKAGSTFGIYGFYAFFSIGLFFIAMEEIAWGQWLFGFETPEAFKAINQPGETTLHNISMLHGRSEIMRLVYGLAGFIGVSISHHPKWDKISVPALLLPWFAIITLHAGVDLINDYIPIHQAFDFAMHETSELIELYIACTAILYPLLNGRIQD